MTEENVKTIEDALSHPSIDEDAAVSAIEALAAMRTRDWDVRVLDAWGAECGDYARSWDNCRTLAACWVAQADGGTRMTPGETPDAARHAAALAVFPTLAAETRARLGECP